MTKSIYVDWKNQVIVATATDKEHWIEDWINDYGLIYDFAEWLESYHDIVEIYNMTEEEKAELPSRYKEYVYNSREIYTKKAEVEFKHRFEEIGIEVSGYAE